jgi:osmoprotectant transport system substrate-binding protein
MSAVRRVLAALAALLVLLGTLSACGDDADSPRKAQDKTVMLVGQNFTEADILTQLYKALLDQQGFETHVKKLGARDLYLDALEKGQVQVAADYLSSFTETLNRKANGDDATPVASSDVKLTLARLTGFGEDYGITPLEPTAAQDGKAYAVTKAYAEKNELTTLSDLGQLGKPVALAAEPGCADRPDCAKGLSSVYGIKMTRVEPLGNGSQETKNALLKGEVQLAQVATTDGSLDRAGLVVLRDDKHWQYAENLVPVVNSAWLKTHPKAEGALNRLSRVLTTADLTAMNAKVDGQQLDAGEAAQEYLKEKGLL